MHEPQQHRAFFAARVMVAALPIAVAFIAYSAVRDTGQPFFGLDAEGLGLGAEIEFLVLHSIGFLGILALVRLPRAEWAVLKWLAVAFLGAMYLTGASNMGGTEGVLLFLSLTLTTYLGFFLRFMTSGAAVSIAVRWIVGLMLFGVAAGICGIEGDLDLVAWSSPDEGLRFGQWFFGLMLAVELTGLYQLKFWDELGETLATEYHEAIPVSQESWTHRIVFGLVPLFGTALLCALPLVVAQAIGAGFFELIYQPYGETLDQRVANMRAGVVLHDWGPVIATGALLAGRCVQINWIARVLVTGPMQVWWHRRGKTVTLGLVGLAYIATGWWLAAHGEQVVRGSFSPGALYSHFVLVEFLLLLALVPMTWSAIVRRLRSIKTTRIDVIR